MALQTRGIFSLREIYRNDRKGVGYPVSDVFIQAPTPPMSNTGYTVSGSGISAADKLNFADDTSAVSPSTADPLGANVLYPFGLSSGSKGFLAGGSGGSSTSEVRKITYSDDTNSLIPATLSSARYNGASLNTETNGYTLGHIIVSSIVDKMNFSTETISRSTDLPATRGSVVAAGNQTLGFLMGGSPGPLSNVDKVIYSSDTYTRVPACDLSDARFNQSAFGNSTHAYCVGGYAVQNFSSVDKIVISSETGSRAPTGNLNIARRIASGLASSSNGYTANGIPAAGSTVEKYNYSTDSHALTPSAYSQYSPSGVLFARGSVSSYSNGNTSSIAFPVQQFTTGFQPGPYVGYSVAGNEAGGQRSMIDKLDFATDTSSTITPFVRNGSSSNGMASLSTYDKGYLAGGAGPNVATITKLMFASDSNSNIPANLNTSRYGVSGSGNNTQGYFYGGQPGTQVSTVEKMTYSTETLSVLSGSPLSAVVYGSSTMSDDGKGYVFGGYVNAWPATTTIQKMNYNSDTIADIPTKTLRDGFYIGTGNKSDHGYLMGGLSPGTTSSAYSDVQKFLLTSDTISAAPGATLHARIWAMSAFSNGSTDAYVRGGNTPGVQIWSTCEKINYDTDTTSAAPGGNLSSARYYVGGLSPRQYTLANPPRPTPTPQTFSTPGPDTALVAGGYNPGLSPSRLTSFQKMNLSTETVSNSTAEFSFGNHNAGGTTGNGTYAFFTSGVNDATSATERVTFATEAIQRMPGMNTINDPVYGSTPVGNTSLGYMMGGAPPNRSYVQKLDFSAESLSAVPGANMPGPRRYGHSAVTPSAGYAIEGQDQTPNPDVYYTDAIKLTYSTESSSAIPAGTIPTYTSAGYGNGVSGPAHAYVPLNVTPLTSGTTIYKFTFSTETAAASPTAELLTPGTKAGGAGDHTAGYFFGGQVWGGSPAAETNINKITYSNDTCSTSPGKLSPARTAGNARSMSMNGMPTATVSNPVIC